MNIDKVKKNAENIVKTILAKTREAAGKELDAYETALPDLLVANDAYLAAKKAGNDAVDEQNTRDIAALKAQRAAADVWINLAPIIQSVKDERVIFLQECFYEFSYAMIQLYADPLLGCMSLDDLLKISNWPNITAADFPDPKNNPTLNKLITIGLLMEKSRQTLNKK